jgi:hypothetical protein
MRTIVFATQKGGSGKSTLAVRFCAGRRGSRLSSTQILQDIEAGPRTLQLTGRFEKPFAFVLNRTAARYEAADAAAPL